MRRLFTTLVVAAAAVLFASPAHAAVAPPTGWVRITSVYSEQCAEADLNHIMYNGDPAQLWDCWGDPGNQKWDVLPQPDGTYKIVNAQSHKCLESDLSHSGNGTPVQLWDCWNDPGNQHWDIYPSPFPTGGAQIVSALTHQCLDADLSWIPSNGTKLQLWTCWNDPGNEHWTLSHIPTP